MALLKRTPTAGSARPLAPPPSERASDTGTVPTPSEPDHFVVNRQVITSPLVDGPEPPVSGIGVLDRLIVQTSVQGG